MKIIKEPIIVDFIEFDDGINLNIVKLLILLVNLLKTQRKMITMVKSH